MLFPTYEFLFLFLPAVVAAYFGIARWQGHRLARLWLLASSLFFYSWWDIRYLPLLCGSIALNYFFGRRVLRHQHWLTSGIVCNVALLAVFKYTGLVPVIPLGISFFTFTQIAWLVDCRRDKLIPPSWSDYALFVAYFPHLLAGPILHHAQMIPQFEDPRRGRWDWTAFSRGLSMLTVGLAKKLLIADQVAPLANSGFAGPHTFSSAWLAALAYTVQIFFDFSGYSDMARGISAMLNLELPVNFNSPYQARNLQQFWQRWHMTLSQFLRDYLFFPLGGARRPYAAVLMTFTIAGIWHGNNWTFLCWGLLHGLGIVVVRAFPWTLPEWAARPITFVTVVWLWVWFRAASVSEAAAMTQAMWSVPSWSWPGWSTATLVLAAVLPLAWFAPASQKLCDRPAFTLRWRLALGLLLALSIASFEHASEFLYFNF